MPSYYKYAERQAASVIDWNKISSSLVDTLKEENTRREELKAQIDKKSFEYGQELNNAPQGDYENANTWILNAADQGQQARLMQDNLLKSGQLKLKDYMVMRRNLEGDFKNMFAVAKEYQDEYKTKMERYQTDKSSKSELQLMETIESLANFTKTSPYINPTTGVISLSKQELKDGVYQPTGDYVSIQSLRNRLKINIDKFDEGNLSSDVKTLGNTTVSSLRKINGMRRIIEVEKTKDPTLRKALEDDKEIGTYIAWENSSVEKYMSNPYSTLSILTDYVGTTEDGEQFKLTFNEEEFNNDDTGQLYLMKDDGSGVLKPTFKEEQKEMVSKYIKNQYRNMIDRERTIDTGTEPAEERVSVAEMEYAEGKGERKRQRENAMNMTALLYRGTQQEVDAATQYFKQSIVDKDGKRLIERIDRNGDGVTIKYLDGSKETIPFKDASGQLIPQDRWVQSQVGLHGIKDIKKSELQGSVDMTKAFNPDATASASVTIPKAKTPYVKQEEIYNEKNKEKGMALADLVEEDGAPEATENLNNRFNNLGFYFVDSSKDGGITDYVSIYWGDPTQGGTKLGDVNLDDSPNIGQFDAIMRQKLKEIDAKAEDDLVGSLDN